MLIESLNFCNISAEEICYPILVKRITLIEMIFVVHYTILTNKGSMIAAIVIGKSVRVIFAENLE